jgi:hypothetical protein
MQRERSGNEGWTSRLVTGAQDGHGGTVEIGLDVRLKEIREGDEGEGHLVSETGCRSGP